MDEAKAQAKGALKAVTAVADAIRDLGEVPSGVLYAHLAGKLSLEAYEKLIGVLKGAGLVRETPSHLLVWTGPEAAEGGA